MIIVEIAGFLGDDPEERFTSNGKRVVALRVATKVRKGGKDETVWWRVNIWDDRFDKMLPYLKKGSAIIVIGEMSKPEIYTARDGTSQVSLNLSAEMLKFSPFGKPGERSSETQRQNYQGTGEDPFAAKTAYANQYAGIGAAASSHQDDLSMGDELPF